MGEGENTKRVDAWVASGCEELCDCRRCHEAIGETRYHDEEKLQASWNKLILLLLTYKEESRDAAARRVYQSKRWGALKDETCVVELSGVAARSSRVEGDRKAHLPERIETIKRRLEEHSPKFVVMYGVGQMASWQEIAGWSMEVGKIVKVGDTCFVCPHHPVSFGLGND